MNNIKVVINDVVKHVTVTEGEHIVIAIVQVGEMHYHNPILIALKHDDFLEVRVEEIIKPPIGLTPRFLHLEQRLQDIKEACKRYEDAGKCVPTDWFAERVRIEVELNR